MSRLETIIFEKTRKISKLIIRIDFSSCYSTSTSTTYYDVTLFDTPSFTDTHFFSQYPNSAIRFPFRFLSISSFPNILRFLFLLGIFFLLSSNDISLPLRDLRLPLPLHVLRLNRFSNPRTPSSLAYNRTKTPRPRSRTRRINAVDQGGGRFLLFLRFGSHE